MSDYCDWDYYEPSEEQQLEWAVYDDAEDPDSHRLQHRQDERWADFLERNKLAAKQAQDYLDRARKARIHRTVTWWELWHPLLDPTGDRLTKHGALSFSEEIKTRDVCSWGNEQAYTLLDSCQKWLNFAPVTDPHLGFPDLRVFPKLYEYAAGNAGDPNGYWDREQRRFRSKVHGIKTTEDQLGNRLAIMVEEPPPYGHWMPVFDLNMKELQGGNDGLANRIG